MATPRHDWYLKEWLRALGKRQSDVVNELDWNKSKVSLLCNGGQSYMRGDVQELAAYLNLEPHELLMHPDEAMYIRRLKADMIRLARGEEEGAHVAEIKKVS